MRAISFKKDKKESSFLKKRSKRLFFLRPRQVRGSARNWTQHRK